MLKHLFLAGMLLLPASAKESRANPYCPIDVFIDYTVGFAYYVQLQLSAGCEPGQVARVRRSSTVSVTRNGFYQINTFGQQGATALDSASVAQLISARYGINSSKGFNGGLGAPSVDILPSYTYGNRNLTTNMPYAAALMLMSDWRAERAGLGLAAGPTS